MYINWKHFLSFISLAIIISQHCRTQNSSPDVVNVVSFLVSLGPSVLWFAWALARGFRADLDGTIFPYDSSMWLAHVTSTTQIVSCKSDIEHLHSSCTQHKKCGRILKHVLKPYDSCSHNQNVGMTSCTRSLLDASRVRYKSHIRQL